MRFARPFTAFLVISLLVSVVLTGGPLAIAQSTEDARDEARDAQTRSSAASGLVDEAVADRDTIEQQLADSIVRMNEIASQLSLVGANIDRIAAQVGYADVEMAGIQSDIEDQAVDAYMTVVASPSVSVVNSPTVEQALVASSVVEDVVADGRLTVGELSAKRKGLESLKETFLADQEEYQALQEQMDAEVANYTALFEQADAEVAQAIRDAEQAERDYLEALSAVEVAKAKDEERRRQEARAERETSTTSSTVAPGTTATTSAGTPPTTTSPSNPTTTAPKTTTSTSGGGGGGWDHPPAVEQWRGLVSAYFPANRVEEALAIIDCESNGDPNAVNPYSGAAGLFQFLPSTWASTAPNAGFSGASATDPEANIGSAAWLANRYQQLGKYYWSPWSCKRVLN
ncbi:MAG: transglycosylase SLT domain-containing protein [Acidimicrobiia bacterium]